jgi:hypothetical protein
MKHWVPGIDTESLTWMSCSLLSVPYLIADVNAERIGGRTTVKK